MDLVDEEDDIAVLLDIFDDLFEALFKLAAVLCPRQHAGKIEREHRFAEQEVGHFALDDGLRQPFDHGALAHARLADEHGVVFGAAGEHLDDLVDLFLSADDGVDLPLARLLRQIDAEAHGSCRRLLLPRSPLVLRGLAEHLLISGISALLLRFGLFFAEVYLFREGIEHLVDVYPQHAQQAHAHRLVVDEDGEQHELGAHARPCAVALDGEFAGFIEHVFGAGSEAAELDALVEGAHEGGAVVLLAHARRL